MNNLRLCAAAILVCAVLFGCGETKEVTLYLQGLQVRGPAMNPPVHITQNPEGNEVHIIPRFSVGSTQTMSGRIQGHTKVNRNGVFRVDTVFRSDSGVVFQDRGNVNVNPFDGKNLTRKFPSYSVGADIDVGLSKVWALSFGTLYSSMDGQGLWSYRAGLGIRSHKGSMGFRIEFGWQWEEFVYEAYTVVTERPLSSSVSTVSFYRDEAKKTFGRFYGSLVLNTVRDNWPVNLFFQVALTGQKLDEIQPRVLQEQLWVIPPFFIVPAEQNLVHDLRGSFSSTFVHVSPGLFINLDENVRVLTGVRISFGPEIDDRSNATIVAPFVQIDLRL